MVIPISMPVIANINIRDRKTGTLSNMVRATPANSILAIILPIIPIPNYEP